MGMETEKKGLERAKDEIRTRDPQLGKLMLYQLSYFRWYVANVRAARVIFKFF